MIDVGTIAWKSGFQRGLCSEMPFGDWRRIRAFALVAKMRLLQKKSLFAAWSKNLSEAWRGWARRLNSPLNCVAKDDYSLLSEMSGDEPRNDIELWGSKSWKTAAHDERQKYRTDSATPFVFLPRRGHPHYQITRIHYLNRQP